MGWSQVWIFLALVALLNAGFAITHSGCGSCQSPARNPVHDHHHSCDHGHDHHHEHHHHHEEEALIRRKLPEELAEEEDLKLYGFGSHHDHDYGHGHFDAKELSGLGLWLNALGCSFLVSMASLICLIILPVIFVQGKPSRAVVDSLALFGAGAMLGDAFLHQLPHAFGGEHSHTHDHHDNHAHPGHPGHEHSHAHSLKDLSVGISVLAGIVLFLLVEKLVRYVDDNSRGAGAWGHSHHHHHHKNSRKEKDDADSNDDVLPPPTSNKKNKKRKSAKDDKPDTGAATNDTKSLHQEEPAQPPSNLVFGYLNLFSDGVHNFTDGMALGSAFLLYGSVGGWSRTLFLLAHELPQEVGDFGILVRSGFSVSKALFFNFLSALVALAGTAMALLMGKDPGQSSLIEGFTAGGFIYIAVAGVLAEMNNSSSVTLKSTVVHLTSLILGMAIALGISLVE